MVGSCGADASVVACWMGWIRTLASVLVVSLGGIVSSVGALSWSYGLWWFKEVRNGVKGFMCVISRCAGLCWHFNNFPWLCKVFLQTFLHFASQFRNLKAISTLGGDFVVILKLWDHFAANGQFRNPFRSSKVISQPILQLQNECTGLRSGTRVPKGDFTAAKHPSKWRLVCEIPAQLCALIFKWP